MPWTFGQLFMELEKIKSDKDSQKLLEADLVFRDSEGDTHIELAVTLPGRQLILVPKVSDDGG